MLRHMSNTVIATAFVASMEMIIFDTLNELY